MDEFMTIDLEMKSSQLAKTIVNNYAFLGNKRVFILTSILIFTFSVLSLKNVPVLFFAGLFTLLALYFRRRNLIREVSKTLLSTVIYHKEANGYGSRDIDGDSLVGYATDVDGSRWSGLSFPYDGNRIFKSFTNRQNGYIVKIPPLRGFLFIREALMKEIKEVSPYLEIMPQKETPPQGPEEPQKKDILFILLCIFIPSFAALFVIWLNV